MKILVVGATGGLGVHLVLESLSRGHTVSALVRDADKLRAKLGNAAAKLDRLHVGDASDPAQVEEAARGMDTVLSGSGAVLPVARALAEGVKNAGAGKLVYVAGATNVLADDGVTPAWKEWAKVWPGAETAFKSHSACIDAIRASGINYSVFCPAMMREVGKKTVPPPAIRINRQSGPFVSYEDAAQVMVTAAEVKDYDGQLFTAATKRE
ncbi:hypothetical protein DFJ74DRAFT_646975 [Hyaloraphidium curvatum]|nr:hypothetical protein DFJ74DRAFT_646975 [Hyaloraphidium curvatum]